MTSTPFDARLVRGPALRDSALEIVYDGTAPPTALFEELRSIGWIPPVPAPPPAAAIDWTRPDPVTGARYSLRSYEAVGLALPGPDAQDVAALEQVVQRHTTAAPTTMPPPAPPAPAPPAPAAAPSPEETAPRERETQIGATLDEEEAARVRDALVHRGFAVRSTRMSLSSPGGFRGNAAETNATAIRLQLRVPVSRVDEAVALLGPTATDVVVRR